METNHNELEKMEKNSKEETIEMVAKEINSGENIENSKEILDNEKKQNEEQKESAKDIKELSDSNEVKKNEKVGKFSFVRVLIIIILLLIIGILVFFRLRIKEEVVMQELPVVDVMTIGRGDIYNTVSVSGNIMPKDTYKVLAKTSGEITKIFVKNGDYVHYGDPICEIDNKKGIDAAFISYDASKKQYERMKALYNSGDISKQNFEQVKAQYDANKLSYETQVENSIPTATGDGYIDNSDMTVGENKNQNEICCYITSNEGKKIQFSVTERAIKGINVGDNVIVEKAGRTYNATIYDKASLVNENTGLFDIKASFNERNDLSQGILAKVTSIYDESINTLILPRQVIYYENEKPLVYVIDASGRILTKFLTLGIETDEEVEVLSGVDEKDKIISTWTSDLVDGTEVKIMSTKLYVPIKKVGRNVNNGNNIIEIKNNGENISTTSVGNKESEKIDNKEMISSQSNTHEKKEENIEETVDLQKIKEEVKNQQAILDEKIATGSVGVK